MTPEEQAAETARQLQEAKDRAAFLESESKKAFEARDKAKAEAEELRKAEAELKALKEKQQTEQGQFKELAEAKAKEAEELKKQLDELSPKVKTFEEQLTKIETERREELLSQLDDKHKEFAKDLSLDKLKAYVDLNKDEKLNTPGGKAGAYSFGTTDGKKYYDFTTKELAEIEKKNPELLKKLFSERNKK